jgi:hypothetical protein
MVKALAIHPRDETFDFAQGFTEQVVKTAGFIPQQFP